MTGPYDALIVVSFGGPEGPDDVLPFLENVVRGKNVPRERLLEVAHHYEHFGGVSPINAQNRALVAALQRQFDELGPRLPVFLGNRNWGPLLADTLATMRERGIRRALALFTSAYSSYSSCRQYLEDVARAREAVGAGAPVVDKLRVFFHHPGFIEPTAERVRSALDQLPEAARGTAPILFTAHSIPLAMAGGCAYAAQLEEASRLVIDALGAPRPWRLVYQSRSGPPSQPWLEPDIGDALKECAAQGIRYVVVAPIGFLSDHIEILWDLDTEAQQLCGELGVTMVRAQTVGAHPRFVRMVRELVLERLDPTVERAVLGKLTLAPDECPADCCPSGRPAATKPKSNAAQE